MLKFTLLKDIYFISNIKIDINVLSIKYTNKYILYTYNKTSTFNNNSVKRGLYISRSSSDL